MPYASHAQVGKSEPMPTDGSVTNEELASTWRAENESRRLDLQEEQHAATTSAAGAGASSGGNALTKKAGPLPVWAWILIGSAAAYLLYKHFTANTTGTTTSVSNLLPTGTGDASGSSSGAGGSSSGTGGGTTPATPGFKQLNTIADVLAAAKAGQIIYEQNAQGAFVPTSYGYGTGQHDLSGFSKYPLNALLSEIGAVPLFTNAGTSTTPGGSSGIGPLPASTAASNPISPLVPTGMGTVAGGIAPGNPPIGAAVSGWYPKSLSGTGATIYKAP